MKKIESILAIDRGTKYIGLAYVQAGEKVVFPIGSLYNDGGFFFNLSDIIQRYRVKTVVVGYPKNEDGQKLVDKFIISLSMILDPETPIIKFDEEYSSVEAGATTGEFEKSSSTDTLAAMKILENYISQQTSSD